MRSGATGDIVAVLDLGSSKVCCMIAERLAGRRGTVRGQQDEDGRAGDDFRLLGFGHFRSRGVKSGVIVDLDAAEQAAKAAMAEAEGEAGLQVSQVYVTVACGRPKSLNFRAEVGLPRGVVSVDDLEKLWAGAREYVEHSGRALVALNAVDYCLDGCDGVRDPRGLLGQTISADMHAVTADVLALGNIGALVSRCFLDVAGFVPSGLASGLAATTAEEREAGVTCIDIGGGVTTLAAFAGGRLLHTDLIPFGSHHISLDIARDLAISLEEADRLKSLHGSVLHASLDDMELVGYEGMMEGEVVRKQVVRSRIREIVEHRVRMLLDMTGEQLAQAEICGVRGGQRLVLTGGGSLLLGLAEYSANMFGRPVRVGGPAVGWGEPKALNSPVFSSIIGVLEASSAANHLLSYRFGGEDRFGGSLEGSLSRVGRWIRDSF